MQLNKNKEKLSLFIFLAAVFIFIVCWIIVQPVNSGPDEEMRFVIVDYIMNNWSLPDGRDEQIINSLWGISYAYYPILAYMVMAVPAKIASLFTSDITTIYIAARLVNAVFGTITAYFVYKLSKRFFKGGAGIVFPVFVAFLPQMVFINSYVNNDSLAVMSVAWILYVCAIAVSDGWSLKLCVSYACAVSVCLLSYYNAYGMILCSAIFYLVTVMVGCRSENKVKYFSQRTILILAIVLVLAGWWFIRNYILYDGDFLALRTSSQYAEIYASPEYKPSVRETLADKGYNPLSLITYSQWGEGNWIEFVAASFVGVFGYMNIFMPKSITVGYVLLIIVGLAGCFTCLPRLFRISYRKGGAKSIDKKAVLNWCMLFGIIITFGLLVYYNLYSDVQAQGRYLFPAAIPILYFVAEGWDSLLKRLIKNEKVRTVLFYIATAILVAVSIYVYATVLYPAYN